MAHIISPDLQRQELQDLRASISCVVVLEQAGYRLDREATAQRSARNLKFRRGEGEIIIVNHGGKGWWSPCDNSKSDKGDVFKLVQFLNPGLSLGHVRQELRALSGRAPSLEVAQRTRERDDGTDQPRRDPSALWSRRQAPSPGSAAWRYLNETRGLPDHLLHAAARQDALREGPQGTAWFAHRDRTGQLSGMEMRGPAYRGFSTGGIGKRLFRFRADDGAAPVTRIVLAEAAIDALSFAAMDRFANGTLYVSVAGGMSPEAEAELRDLLGDVARQPEARFVIAVDNDPQGDRYAAKFTTLAQEVGVWSGRASPHVPGEDWNTVLRARGEKGQAA